MPVGLIENALIFGLFIIMGLIGNALGLIEDARAQQR